MPIEIITSHYTATFFANNLLVFSHIFSYDVMTTLGHERLSTVLEKMSLYSWVVRPWHPHRYEGPHHSTQDLKYICQNRDNDLILRVPQKWGTFMFVPQVPQMGYKLGTILGFTHMMILKKKDITHLLNFFYCSMIIVRSNCCYK